MDQLKALPLGRQLILGAGILLLLDSFLNWQQVDGVTVNGVRVGVSGAGLNAWHGFLGIVMCLALIVLLAWTAARAFNVALPDQVPDGLTTLGLGVLIPVFALIKAIHGPVTHWPAWIGVILGAVLAYGAWQVFAESGEKLPSMPARDTAA